MVNWADGRKIFINQEFNPDHLVGLEVGRTGQLYKIYTFG